MVLIAGPWYKEKCRELNTFVSQFKCQELELDLPILYWGKDLVRGNDNWEKGYSLKNNKLLNEFNDAMKMLKNIYRVLMTRGRDDIIWMPDEDEKTIQTYDYFKNIGIKEIK